MNKILIWLVGLLSLLAAIFGYIAKFFKEKAESAERRADAAEEIIEDVETANRIRRDIDERVRVEAKYTRK